MLPPESQKLKRAFLDCSADEDKPVIIFVSKMVSVDDKTLPENRPKVLTHEEMAIRREAVKKRIEEKNKTYVNSETDQREGAAGAQIVTDHITEIETPKREDENFVAFARIYSGTIKKGAKLFVLGPKHDPSISGQSECDIVANSLKDLKPGYHITRVTIESLYQLMGRELEALESVPAGNIFGGLNFSFFCFV